MVQEPQTLLAFAEAAAQSVIEEENSFVDGYAIDDDEHLPRIRRIIEAVAKAALNAGESRAAVADLRQRLLAFAEDEYMKRWMAEIYGDEDPDAVRQDGLSVFRHVIGGGRRRR
jgi:hypothetical protein